MRFIPCFITFHSIGGYELLKDGTRHHTIYTLGGLRDYFDDRGIDYCDSLNPIRVAKSAADAWMATQDDGGGRGWITYGPIHRLINFVFQ